MFRAENIDTPIFSSLISACRNVSLWLRDSQNYVKLRMKLFYKVDKGKGYRMSLKLDKKLNQNPKQYFAKMLEKGNKVLDVGCWNYSFKQFCDEQDSDDLKHYGVDREELEQPVPEGYIFVRSDLNNAQLPFENETFDAVVASHIIEHVNDQLGFLEEIFRVLKIGGLIYIECPSVRSLRFPSMPFKFEEFRSINFYDDPTHFSRPHSPQSLYRLFRMYGGEVLKCDHIVRNEIRWKFPYLIMKAWLKHDGAMLEETMWNTFGFAVYGIAKKQENSEKHYVLSS